MDFYSDKLSVCLVRCTFLLKQDGLLSKEEADLPLPLARHVVKTVLWR